MEALDDTKNPPPLAQRGGGRVNQMSGIMITPCFGMCPLNSSNIIIAGIGVLMTMVCIWAHTAEQMQQNTLALPAFIQIFSSSKILAVSVVLVLRIVPIWSSFPAGRS